jgi:hypothetical protein
LKKPVILSEAQRSRRICVCFSLIKPQTSTRT